MGCDTPSAMASLPLHHRWGRLRARPMGCLLSGGLVHIKSRAFAFFPNRLVHPNIYLPNPGDRLTVISFPTHQPETNQPTSTSTSETSTPRAIMPRIPVRTKPYHLLPRCTRHYKSKRDLILRLLGKASFINGSQFVIAWVSPRGEVDVFASDLLQSAISPKDGPPAVNKKDLEREAMRVRPDMLKRWEEIRRLEEAGEAPTLEDDDEPVDVDEVDDDGDDENLDADQTMVHDESPTFKLCLKTSLPKPTPAPKRPSPTHMSSFSARPPTRASTPGPAMHTITLAPNDIEAYYMQRFSALQQATCKLVVKAWIKIIEPKKQVKFPYNKGDGMKPEWWPASVRHKEPDHLQKPERMTLLSSILRSPLISVARLELSTAEAGAFISRPRQSILREMYTVAKEEERRRKENDTKSDLVVHLPDAPVSPSQISPDGPEKRTRSAMEGRPSGKENPNAPLSYAAHASKRTRYQPQPPRLAPLTTTTSISNYDPYPTPTYNYIPNSNPWRPEGSLGVPPPHLSPYPAEWSTHGSDYARSPVPEHVDRYAHNAHLAPILTPGISQGSTPEPPMYVQSAPLSNSNSQPPSATYYDRSYVQHQQQDMDYLHHSVHPAYDYASPYLTDAAWENPFNSHGAHTPQPSQ